MRLSECTACHHNLLGMMSATVRMMRGRLSNGTRAVREKDSPPLARHCSVWILNWEAPEEALCALLVLYRQPQLSSLWRPFAVRNNCGGPLRVRAHSC